MSRDHAVVRVDRSHLDALERAIRSVEAEQHALNRWGLRSVDQTLALEALDELRERMRVELGVTRVLEAV